MAAEVMDLEYLFLPVDLGTFLLRKMQALSISGNPPSIRPPFRYNRIHDVESIWWCGLYLLFFNVAKGVKETSQESSARQVTTAALFPAAPNGCARDLFLIDGRKQENALGSLTWATSSELSHTVAVVNIIMVAGEFVNAYETFEACLVEPPDQYVAPDSFQVHSKLAVAFSEAEKAFNGIEIEEA